MAATCNRGPSRPHKMPRTSPVEPEPASSGPPPGRSPSAGPRTSSAARQPAPLASPTASASSSAAAPSRVSEGHEAEDFAALVSRTFQLVRAILVRAGIERGERDDAAQEVYL